MKIEEQNLNEPQNPQLNIGAVSGSSYECMKCYNKSANVTKKHIQAKNNDGSTVIIEELTCDKCGFVWCE